MEFDLKDFVEEDKPKYDVLDFMDDTEEVGKTSSVELSPLDEDVTEENIEQQKQVIKDEEYKTYQDKINSLPSNTQEEKIAKKKAQIALIENKEDPTLLDRMLLSTNISTRTMISPFIGIAEFSEDVANLFRDRESKTIEDFRKDWDNITNNMLEKLGYDKDDFFTPKTVGQVAGEVATVFTGQKALSTVSKAATGLKTTTALETGAAFFGELGVSGDYQNAITSGALAGSIAGAIGRFVEGRALDPKLKESIDSMPPEELNNIANVYEFARLNNIDLTDSLLANNPNAIIAELKSFNAPQALVDYAETLSSDTSKKLLDVFNDALVNAKPKDLESIELRKIAEMMQEQAKSLKQEMTKVKDDAYEAMKESDYRLQEVSTKEVLDTGLRVIDTYRGDSSLVNAFKRNVLKNIKNLDSDSLPIAKRIETLEAKIARNEDRLAGFEVSGIDTESLQKTINADYAELDKITEKIDMDRVKNVTLEDMVGIIQDMNELKYSGSAHIATKGAKEQALLTKLNEEILSKIEASNPEFHELAVNASEKARDIFSKFGKAGRGTQDFPELEKIRLAKNPDEFAKKIFTSDAIEEGYKIEKTLEILGSRSNEFKNKVLQKYINDAVGGLETFTKNKNTIKQTTLDLDKGYEAISKLIGNPEIKRLTTKIIGENNVDTLETLNNFIKNFGDNLKAMKTPVEKQEAGILSAPLVKQVAQLINYTVYKARNIGIYKDKYHSTQYQKAVNKYVKEKIKEFETGKKTNKDMQRLSYALSASVIEKAITEE